MGKASHRMILLSQIAICLLFVSSWEFVGRSSKTAFFLVGSPTAIAMEFKRLLLSGDLVWHFVMTGSEAVVGLAFGTLVGGCAGLMLWYSEATALIARPFIIGLGTLPVFAFAPLMIVWFGIGWWMKVALAGFSTVFVAFNQSYRGATLVSMEHVEMLRGMNASRHQVFFKVIVPGSLDWVLSSMRLNVGFGLLGAFIGEFIAADRGLGYLILRAGGLYNIPRAFAAAIGITVLALSLDWCARWIERHRHSLVQILSVPKIIWNG